jgi:hypothetical protein
VDGTYKKLESRVNIKLITYDITEPIDETEFNKVHALFNELGLHYTPNVKIYIYTLLELSVNIYSAPVCAENVLKYSIYK